MMISLISGFNSELHRKRWYHVNWLFYKSRFFSNHTVQLSHSLILTLPLVCFYFVSLSNLPFYLWPDPLYLTIFIISHPTPEHVWLHLKLCPILLTYHFLSIYPHPNAKIRQAREHPIIFMEQYPWCPPASATWMGWRQEKVIYNFTLFSWTSLSARPYASCSFLSRQ